MTEKLVNDLVARHGVFGELNGYRVIPVYKNAGPEAQQAITQLWLKNKILPPQQAQERVKQVVFMIVGPKNDVVGVNTVYVDDFSKFKQKPAPAGNFYFYRMFIQKQDRVPRLSFKTLDMTYDYLNSFPAGNPRPQGIVLVTENPKLKKEGAQRLLQRMGWAEIGRNEMGQIVMKRDFVRPS